MTWEWGAFTFVVTFSITLFMVLPLRLKFWRGLLVNILLAAVITLGIYLLVRSNLVPVRYVVQ